MKITRKSMFSGITRTMELNITEDQIRDYNSGTSIQNAFSNLTPDEREFLQSGATPEEWDEAFGEEEEEYSL